MLKKVNVKNAWLKEWHAVVKFENTQGQLIQFIKKIFIFLLFIIILTYCIFSFAKI